MRTLAITLVTAFVFLLGLQLTAASSGRDREERGASQAVVAGSIRCATSPRGQLHGSQYRWGARSSRNPDYGCYPVWRPGAAARLYHSR